MSTREITSREITGKHVLLICLGFFGMMFAVNVVFAFFAVTTFNGGEGGKAYQKGLDYNQTIAAARAQDALGWSHWIEAGAAGQVGIVMQDKGGAPLTGMTVAGEIARPVDERFTRTLAFKEVQPGLYHANAGPLDAGNWIVTFDVRSQQDGAVVYRGKERLWLKPNS